VTSLPVSSREEIRHVSSGGGTCRLGVRELKVTSGDILLVPPGVKEIVMPDAVLGLGFGVISISQEMPPEAAGTLFVHHSEANILRHRRLSSELAITIRDSLVEKSREQPGWADFVESQVRIFMVKLHRFMQRPNGVLEPGAASPGDLHRRVADYIRNLDLMAGEPDTIETAAEKLAISPRRFTDLFREITGMSRLEYVHTQRLMRAKELLLSRRDSIEHAAYQAGFEDLTTFYRVFRRREGMTPGRWRDRHQPAENEGTACRKCQ
jgi:AraC-like DNA-binding protein